MQGNLVSPKDCCSDLNGTIYLNFCHKTLTFSVKYYSSRIEFRKYRYVFDFVMRSNNQTGS